MSICLWTLSREGIEDILPSDAHSVATDRLHVSITHSKSGRNHVVSRFSSREELIKVTPPHSHTLINIYHCL